MANNWINAKTYFVFCFFLNFLYYTKLFKAKIIILSSGGFNIFYVMELYKITLAFKDTGGKMDLLSIYILLEMTHELKVDCEKLYIYCKP